MFAGFSAFMLSKMGFYPITALTGVSIVLHYILWKRSDCFRQANSKSAEDHGCKLAHCHGSLTVYLLLLHKCNSILSLILAGFPAFFFVKFLKYFCSYF